MACTQTLNGLTRDCEANTGGVKNVYIANFDDVEGLTFTSGVVTAIAMATGKKFKRYHFKRGQASVVQTSQYNEAGDYAGESNVLSINFLRQDATKRLEMIALSVAELAVIYEDNNGTFFYLGADRPVLRTGGESGSGAAITDTNRYGLELTDQSNALPPTIASSAVEAVID